MPSVQASIFSSVLSRPASDIALVCSCLQTPATVSTTSTETVLSTIVVTPVASVNKTITPPVITVQVTETAFVTDVVSITYLTSTTTTATATATTTATAATCSEFFNCDNFNPLSFSCSSNGGCACVQIAGTTQGFCSSGEQTSNCQTSSDCPQGYVCGINTCLGSVCLQYDDASCPNPAGQAAARRRFRRVAAHRSVWNPVFDRYTDLYTDPSA